MKIEVKHIIEMLGILERQCLDWITTGEIQNSLRVKGTDFCDRSYCRVAYYDEAQNLRSIHKN